MIILFFYIYIAFEEAGMLEDAVSSLNRIFFARTHKLGFDNEKYIYSDGLEIRNWTIINWVLFVFYIVHIFKHRRRVWIPTTKMKRL